MLTALLSQNNLFLMRWVSLFESVFDAASQDLTSDLLLTCVQSLASLLFRLSPEKDSLPKPLLIYFTKRVIENSWALLDEPLYRSRALTLILSVNESFHEAVITSLKASLREDSASNVKNATLQRCAIFHASRETQFLKKTQDCQKDHLKIDEPNNTHNTSKNNTSQSKQDTKSVPNEPPAKPANNKHKNTTNSKNASKLVNFCVFSLLDFLDSDDPKLRLTSKSWLVDSSTYFEDILDLFLSRLLASSNLLRTESNDYFYTKPYNFSSIFHLFKILKSTLYTIPEIFARYVYTHNISHLIQRELSKKLLHAQSSLNFGAVHFLGRNRPFNHYNTFTHNELKHEIKYLDCILYTLARYIAGDAIAALDPDFVEPNHVVSNLACELLEELIKILENMGYRVVNRTLLVLVLFEYRKVTILQNTGREMELLSLLKAILFKSCLFAPNQVERVKYFFEIFEKFKLQNDILRSLKHQASNYSVFQILGIVESCVDLIGSFDMTELILQETVQNIFKTYFQMIMSTRVQNRISKLARLQKQTGDIALNQKHLIQEELTNFQISQVIVLVRRVFTFNNHSLTIYQFINLQ